MKITERLMKMKSISNPIPVNRARASRLEHMVFHLFATNNCDNKK